MKKDEIIFIKHILDSINDIECFLKNQTKSLFLKDKEKQYAVARAMEIIGEATKNISLEFRNKLLGNEILL